jgi:hypothetical protein
MLTHYEELLSMCTRLDKVLPGESGGKSSSGSRFAQLEGWSWRNTVIEAKPVSLALLDQEAKVFRGEIPDQYQTTQSRRWYVQEQTRHTSSANSIEGLDGISLPQGTSLWHAPDDARRLLVLARHDAKLLFEARDGWRASMPCEDNWESHGRLSLFAMPGPCELCLRDCMRLLRPMAPYLARLVEEYARGLCWMYGFEALEFEEGCRLSVTWLAGGRSKPVELPPASPCRFENGPIALVGVGLPVVAHDLVPVLPGEDGLEWPVRVSVPEGVVVCTDGASRMRYAHGHPPSSGQDEGWFFLTFQLDCNRRSLAVAYERETRAVVMQTPVVGDRVVTCKRNLLPALVGGGSHADAISRLVKNMRRRVRVAESHQAAERSAARYERDRQALLETGSSAKSSSSSVLA